MQQKIHELLADRQQFNCPIHQSFAPSFTTIILVHFPIASSWRKLKLPLDSFLIAAEGLVNKNLSKKRLWYQNSFNMFEDTSEVMNGVFGLN